MNNLLIAIAVFVITVVAALFAVPYFIDWNSYRGWFEQEARKVVGREVQVDGDVKLHLLPTPYFRLEKVRIADAGSSLPGHFFKTDSLSIKLSIAPLFRGVLEAHEIEFQRPVLRLALDAKGGWNWQSFAQALRSAGYVPANVSLASLRIRDGVLALHGSDGAEYARLEGLNGELSAPALEGPYRFKGEYGPAGRRRDLRLVTSLPEADGSVPFRMSLRLPETNTSYLMDARAIDLMGKTRIKGNLTARLPLPGRSLIGTQRSPGDTPDLEPASDAREGFELKAAIEADAAGANLPELTLTFDQSGRLQTIAGTLKASWRKAFAVDMDLSSRWLDLDRVVGVSRGTAAIDGLAKLAAWAQELLPADGKARALLRIEQANLGGEAVGPVRLRLAQAGRTLEIEDLRLELPGATSAVLKGAIVTEADEPAFKGRLDLKGTSAGRFLTWATGQKVSLGTSADNAPFEIRTGLLVDATQAAAPDLTGSLAGTVLGGTLRYKWAGRPDLLVALEGPKLDARGLVPEGFNLIDALDRLTRTAFAKADAKGPGAAGADLDVRVEAGQLVTAERTYRDLSVLVALKGGHLKQLRLRLSGDEGYGVELQGAVDNLASQPKGSLKGAVMAATAAGIGPLAELLGLPAAFRPGDGRERTIVPLRLAGTLTFGSRTATAADLVLDGEANDAAVRINARLDGGAGGWRSGRADVTASLQSANAAKVTSLLLARDLTAGPGDGAKSGRLLIRANGIPSEGLATVASLEAGDVGLSFRGHLRMGDAGTKAEGDLELRADSATPLMALAGLAPPLKVDGLPVSGKLKLVVEGSSIGIDKLTLQFGAARISGRLALKDAGGRRHIDASLGTDEVSVARLLGLLLDERLAVAGMAEALLEGRRSPWPDEPFSASILDGFEGRVILTSKRLTVAEGLALDRAKIDAVLRPGKIDVKELTGSGLGGEFKASLSVDKAAAGAEVRGKLDFRVALEEIAGGGSQNASGPMKGTISFNGRGLSPRAVMAALQGKGSVTFDSQAKLGTLWPGIVAAAADAALKAEAGKLVATLRERLAAGLGTGALALEKKTLTLEIADGQLRSKTLVVDTDAGRTSGTVRLDLNGLALDSQWRLQAAGPDSKPLPQVSISYRGALVSLSALDPQIDAAALEQELSARRIAQDMEELDRLRKLEEQRRLDEAERVRKQFEKLPPIPPPLLPPTGPVAPNGETPAPAKPG
jgi:hypothetical protein